MTMQNALFILYPKNYGILPPPRAAAQENASAIAENKNSGHILRGKRHVRAFHGARAPNHPSIPEGKVASYGQVAALSRQPEGGGARSCAFCTPFHP